MLTSDLGTLFKKICKFTFKDFKPPSYLKVWKTIMPTLSTIDKTVLKETHHSAKRISLFPENFKTGL